MERICPMRKLNDPTRRLILILNQAGECFVITLNWIEAR